MKTIHIILFVILLLKFNSIFSQEIEDDETLIQLKKALAPHIKDKVQESKKTTIVNKLPKDVYALQKKDNSTTTISNACLFPYLHGVASGDPLNDRVIIWTRVTPITASVTSMQVNYELATDVNFTNIVSTGSIQTDSTKDYTVKFDVQSLNENTYYYYRFYTSGYYSIVGRTKTLPTSSISNIRLAFINCNDYRTGYFNPFYKIAERNDLDAVVHLGDYIYEGGGGPAGRLHDPNAEIWRLIDYRARLSQYHLDSNLRRCHQLYPWINIWDDHDIVVDAVRDTSERHDGSFGSYQVRKYAAIKAFREWLPVRVVDSTDYYKNWRKFSFGNLLDLLMLDVRLYDRDRFATGTTDPIYNSPTAKMCGPTQLSWIKSELSSSNKKWKILANGLMFGQLKIAGIPLVFENWDGYNHERDDLFNHINSNNIDNVIVTSGDFHCSFANDIASNPYNIFNYNPFNGNGSLAVEFIPPSVSSDNFDRASDCAMVIS
jgi:alkaline phosphatase D